jgi:hypothetical protein
MNDRKFVFDWDAQDDTFAEDSPVAVGSNRQGAQVMFGRGRLAGMDDGGGTGPRKSGSGFDARLADPMERRKAAKAGLDERHWTDKPLDEMKERDWRIFREDFSISARGLSALAQNTHRILKTFLWQVVTFPILYGLGQSQRFRSSSWVLSTRSDTKTLHLFSVKPFQSVSKTEISSASLRQVRFNLIPPRSNLSNMN